MRNEKLIHALGNCINHCNYCADACLDEDNVKMMAECIRLDRVCGEVCAALSQVLAIKVPTQHIKGLVQYCREICEKCAEECEKHEHQHCKDCAEACRKCAEACASF